MCLKSLKLRCLCTKLFEKGSTETTNLYSSKYASARRRLNEATLSQAYMAWPRSATSCQTCRKRGRCCIALNTLSLFGSLVPRIRHRITSGSCKEQFRNSETSLAIFEKHTKISCASQLELTESLPAVLHSNGRITPYPNRVWSLSIDKPDVAFEMRIPDARMLVIAADARVSDGMHRLWGTNAHISNTYATIGPCFAPEV